jgi:hypothetical protein
MSRARPRLAQTDADEAAAPAASSKQRATPTQAKRKDHTKTPDDANDAKAEQTAKAV